MMKGGRRLPLFVFLLFKMYKMEKLKQDIRDYQLNKGKTYIQYEQDKYSAYQNYLYKRALYGLDALTEKELKETCSKKKQRIVNVYRRAQVVLNRFKQEVTIKKTNYIFEKFFPKSELTYHVISSNETDDSFKNTLTFKDLNITKDDIVTIFIVEGVLPKNFLSLKEAPINLPSLKNETKIKRM
jgi:hypothetical protein